ncbi:purple acid phosphatase family protein [Kitasatospora sp. NBC_01266]|uniref:purple acid phosphatase family protein n=1 Tax=Kitasatospora sp. NBC_01266 TaxID=2903572 RepID=UPI002E33504E|nr:metallophosphoesterase family protein [Kitasatospora sp. NBC_01266]
METDIPNMGVPERLAARMSMAEQHDYLRSRLSRRRVLRSSAITVGALAVGGALSTGSAYAAPKATPTLVTDAAASAVDGSQVIPVGRHLQFGAEPDSEFRISWQVPVPVKKPFLRYGRTPWDLSHKVEAELRSLHTPALVPGQSPVDQYYLHVALEDLDADTTYYYGVGHQGFDPAAQQAISTLGSFHTAASRDNRWGKVYEPFTFTAFGDQGVSTHAANNDHVILAQNPKFHLHAGDICYADPDGTGTDPDKVDFNPRTWDSFLVQTEPISSKIPWMVAYGNHDMEAWYSHNGYGGEDARWYLPSNGPDPRKAPGVYAFRYSNVGVISLDANDVSYEIPANLGLTAGRQTSWLERTIKDFRNDETIDFVVVFFHHCAFSTTVAHASEGGVREAWVPIFEKYRVDLVINGHNHVYERTDAILGNKVSKAIPSGATLDPEKDGVVYVTAGAAGRSLYSFGAPQSYEGHEQEVDSIQTFYNAKGQTKVDETVEWSRVRYLGYSFIKVDVTPAHLGQKSSMKVTALTETGQQIDHYTIVRTVGEGWDSDSDDDGEGGGWGW